MKHKVMSGNQSFPFSAHCQAYIEHVPPFFPPLHSPLSVALTVKLYCIKMKLDAVLFVACKYIAKIKIK